MCPEHIKITDNGIIPMKERVVDVKYDPVRFLGFGRRKNRPPAEPAPAPSVRQSAVDTPSAP